ncbi:MAG: hypothetical protein HKN87_10075 [Saprospiraceae bacterium]|nr:hypothetical protein [Saprospiraceae bacterium]
MKYTLIYIPLLFLGFSWDMLHAESCASNWQAGVAKLDITPSQSMWMAGYGARESPSEGTLHRLWAKALVVKDANGHRGVLITTDLVGVPRQISNDIRNGLQNKLGLERSQIILNTSHTHTGPVLSNALFDIYPLTDAEIEKINSYSKELVERIIDVVQEAHAQMEPVRIFSGNGVARFQVNRRNNTEATLVEQTSLSGPNDHAVPVLKLMKMDGKMMAVAFGYACHPTVLGINQWSGDYPGFAQIALEEAHPGAMALFFQGAGADQNPLPRRTIPLAKQYGRTLAAAVDRVLEEDMQQLDPKLRTSYREIPLNLNAPPSIATLEKQCESSIAYYARWAKRLLKETNAGAVFPESYPFPLQVWKMGNQAIFTLGGETVVGYSIQLKEIFGYDSFVMGYTNDVMSYIPTATILHEGGYEGASAQIVYGLHGTWTYDVESVIMENIVDLAKSAGIAPPQNHLIDHR